MKTIKQLQAMQTFKEVAQCKSFSIAAINLGVSKAHISKTINEYEEYLGQSLFERTTRTVKLTFAGESLWQQSVGALETLSNAAESIRNSNTTARGPLRVSAAGAFGEEQITPVLCALAIKYPELKIEIDFTPRKVNLVEENFDVAIRVGELDHSNTSSAVKIAVRQEFLCASEKYFKTKDIPQRPIDLRHHNCLVGSVSSWQFIEKKKPINLKIHGNFSSNNGRALLNATLNGVGISRLPGVYVKEHLETGKLISVLEDYMPKQVPIWALSTEHRFMSPNVQAFLSTLEERFGKNSSEIF